MMTKRKFKNQIFNNNNSFRNSYYYSYYSSYSSLIFIVLLILINSANCDDKLLLNENDLGSSTSRISVVSTTAYIDFSNNNSSNSSARLVDLESVNDTNEILKSQSIISTISDSTTYTSRHETPPEIIISENTKEPIQETTNEIEALSTTITITNADDQQLKSSSSTVVKFDEATNESKTTTDKIEAITTTNSNPIDNTTIEQTMKELIKSRSIQEDETSTQTTTSQNEVTIETIISTEPKPPPKSDITAASTISNEIIETTIGQRLESDETLLITSSAAAKITIPMPDILEDEDDDQNEDGNEIKSTKMSLDASIFNQSTSSSTLSIVEGQTVSNENIQTESSSHHKTNIPETTTQTSIQDTITQSAIAKTDPELTVASSSTANSIQQNSDDLMFKTATTTAISSTNENVATTEMPTTESTMSSLETSKTDNTDQFITISVALPESPTSLKHEIEQSTGMSNTKMPESTTASTFVSTTPISSTVENNKKSLNIEITTLKSPPTTIVVTAESTSQESTPTTTTDSSTVPEVVAKSDLTTQISTLANIELPFDLTTTTTPFYQFDETTTEINDYYSDHDSNQNNNILNPETTAPVPPPPTTFYLNETNIDTNETSIISSRNEEWNRLVQIIFIIATSTTVVIVLTIITIACIIRHKRQIRTLRRPVCFNDYERKPIYKKKSKVKDGRYLNYPNFDERFDQANFIKSFSSNLSIEEFDPYRDRRNQYSLYRLSEMDSAAENETTTGFKMMTFSRDRMKNARDSKYNSKVNGNCHTESVNLIKHNSNNSDDKNVVIDKDEKSFTSNQASFSNDASDAGSVHTIKRDDRHQLARIPLTYGENFIMKRAISTSLNEPAGTSSDIEIESAASSENKTSTLPGRHKRHKMKPSTSLSDLKKLEIAQPQSMIEISIYTRNDQI